MYVRTGLRPSCNLYMNHETHSSYSRLNFFQLLVFIYIHLHSLYISHALFIELYIAPSCSDPKAFPPVQRGLAPLPLVTVMDGQQTSPRAAHTSPLTFDLQIRKVQMLDS